MKRLTVAAIVAAFALTTTHMAFAVDPNSAPTAAELTLADDAKCKRTSFKTGLVKAACKKGLKAAISAMKGFTKKAKKATGEKINCKTCHSGLKKDGYPLKADGLATFKKLKAAVDAAKVRPSLSHSDAIAIEGWVR